MVDEKNDHKINSPRLDRSDSLSEVTRDMLLEARLLSVNLPKWRNVQTT
jgi:hypothetical protein